MNSFQQTRHYGKRRVYCTLCLSAFIICMVFGLLLTSCSKKKVVVSAGMSSGDTSSSDSIASGTESTVDNTVTGTTPANPASGSKTPTPNTTKPTPTTTGTTLPRSVRITIPEGYSLSQIGDKLANNNVCTKAAFLSTINSYNFNYYSLVNRIPTSGNRCYKLEGYLYPDTYDFYTNMKPEDAIGKMLRGAQNHIEGKYSYPGMTTDQIITLASIIEKEAAKTSDMKNISTVLHNRLNRRWQLGCDATIYYIERYVKPNLPDAQKDNYNSSYNTYKCPALPAGPICNPGKNALDAACNPTSNPDLLYFWSDSSGYHFSKNDPKATTTAAATSTTTAGQ